MKHLIRIMGIIAVCFSITACSTSDDIKDSSTNSLNSSYDQDRDSDANKITDSYRYQLPVIFHIFHTNDPEDLTLSTITPERIAFILKNVNDLWRGVYNNSSVDVGVDFVLAKNDEKGNLLDHPGIVYELWNNKSLDVESFMNDNTGQYTKYLWDPNNYINVMIFPFKDDESDGSVTLGITHLPFTTSGPNMLEGLNVTKYTTMAKDNLKFPYCSAINAIYASKEYDSSRYTATTEQDRFNSSMVDVSATLAHELGHYLGLHHVFTENTAGDIVDSCGDTDYCGDTPSYNKTEYDTWLTSYINQHQIFYLDEMDIRHSCAGTTYTASNFMDYSVCTSDLFTNDQRDRIRHVLYYSPLIPGPKKTGASRAGGYQSAGNEPLDLPIMTRK
ncbi:zinc-dependent metalloproteinase lipoprotein [Prevotella cerevisiae]|uniref:Zinc-dependent metalloproteinase lipoprotein n=1 Tax=Segatella cerevisiae TaxID=2053716 RepID=A0ABT1BUS1_9BACT|nr:zinc-dependent metalloproteinase lipoprotein [Segatella cerevisiae]MCO6024821.1 zinc-dependent metalloproteinase lipoprotein [Segatella cerevisiae]